MKHVPQQFNTFEDSHWRRLLGGVQVLVVHIDFAHFSLKVWLRVCSKLCIVTDSLRNHLENKTSEM